jgi:hypothetical protein
LRRYNAFYTDDSVETALLRIAIGSEYRSLIMTPFNDVHREYFENKAYRRVVEPVLTEIKL